MKGVELYGRVRYAVQIEGLSGRAAARRFGLDPRTVAKMVRFSVPPGYVRKKPPAKPKLDPFIPVIDSILRDDKSRPKKQQHTAKRVFERLRDEYRSEEHTSELQSRQYLVGRLLLEKKKNIIARSASAGHQSQTPSQTSLCHRE